jgi:hypothetical protein
MDSEDIREGIDLPEVRGGDLAERRRLRRVSTHPKTAGGGWRLTPMTSWPAPARRAQTAAPISPLAPITRMRTGSLPLPRGARACEGLRLRAPLGRPGKLVPLASPIRRLYPTPLTPIRRLLS